MLSDKNGNVAIIFALTAVVLITVMGAGVDFMRFVSVRQDVRNASDGALLAGSREIQNLLANGTYRANAIQAGVNVANDYFEKNYGSNKGFTPEFSIESNRVSAQGTYNGILDVTLLKLANVPTLPLNVETAVAVANPVFLEIHLVIDTSASLGIGATTADISTMSSAIGCAFACHVPAGHESYGSTVGAARAAGAELRIDVIRDAVDGFVEDIANSSIASNVAVALYTFSNSLTVLETPTDDLSNVRTTLTTVDLDNSWQQGGTSFDHSFQMLSDVVGASGAGNNPSNARKIIILVTDGVATNVKYEDGSTDPGLDIAADPNFVNFAPMYNGAGAWQLQGFDSAVCDNLKTVNAAEVFTLNVEYVIPTTGTDGDDRFYLIENNLKDEIQGNLEDCATNKTNSFKIAQDQQIYDSLTQIFKGIEARNLRITK